MILGVLLLIFRGRVITRPGYQIAESEAFMKAEKIKVAVYKVICLAVKGHG